MRRLLGLFVLALLAACSPVGRRALAPAAPDPRGALLITPTDLARRLEELGCEAAQGYCISRPMPVEQYADWRRGFSWQR